MPQPDRQEPPLRILSVSSSRADVGIFRPLWREMARHQDIESHVLVTGMHIGSEDAACHQIPAVTVCHIAGSDLGGGDAAQAAAGMADIMAGAAQVYGAVMPDLILVIGDRLDMAPAAFAAVPFNIPLAHVHGGELTEGALDDRLRHAVTKLAHLHFTANTDAARRISRMGEEAWRIHVCGAPGLDTLNDVLPMDRAAVFRALGLADTGPLRLATLHPETNSSDPVAPMIATLDALRQAPALPTVFTAPNSDPGGAQMRDLVMRFAEQNPWATYRETLGSELYVNAMRHAGVMIGNSSSGIVEAPLLGLPVINIGNRQSGRLAANNVMACASDPDEIAALLNRLAASAYRRQPASFPYGDGRAAPRIVAALRSLGRSKRLLRKVFDAGEHGFAAPWGDAVRFAS